jgi:hypothetical protein
MNSTRWMQEVSRLNSPTPSSWLILAKLAKVLVKNKFISPEFVFLSRTESGMCNLLHILKARVSAGSPRRPVLAAADRRKAAYEALSFLRFDYS